MGLLSNLSVWEDCAAGVYRMSLIVRPGVKIHSDVPLSF